RRRVGDVAQRHGRVPGRAPGVDRDAVQQVRPRRRARPPDPVLRGDGGAELDLRPARRVVSRHRRRHHHGQGRRVPRRGAGAVDRWRVGGPGGCSDPRRPQAMPDDVERALNVLRDAERPLVIGGKGMASSRAEDEVRAFIERTKVPFLASPMGKGVMPDSRPLSVGAARSHALQNADVVFLMGARLNWIMHFGLPPRYNKNVRFIQLDIAAESIGQNAPTEVALVGDGKAIVAQINESLKKREWVYPSDTPWHASIAEKAAANAAQIAPQLVDDTGPANYYRALKDVAAWTPDDAIIIG